MHMKRECRDNEGSIQNYNVCIYTIKNLEDSSVTIKSWKYVDIWNGCLELWKHLVAEDWFI